ncbi:membrane fusion protein, multidrug efflux system [Nitrosomonas marina]|uniref:Membrane fusion protein, multidrug efflux system n=1 Tax=Nitrosomonas marina TaxID=917 RepID=A0A1H9YQ87_9PROT|nr:efflux RND transporter periplasmic adaptor subunit [Nitrosomonas marina]SES71238.1 membrane fusion protein, multidrug efflux system [Nitrosomonas marina]
MRIIFVSLAVVAALLLLSACSNDTVDTESSVEPLVVGVLQVEPVNMRLSAETIAQTEGAKEIEIRPRVGGIVLKRHYHEGMAVRANEPLYLIDPDPFQKNLAEVQAEFLEQSIRAMKAKTEKERQEKLVAENFVSQRSYDNAVADLMITEAALHALKARVQQAELDLSYTTVKAPIDGITGRSLISEGALVAANSSVLTTMTQISPIWVRFSFSDNELARFNGRLSEDNVEEVILILPDGTEYPISGTINFAASEIDPLIGTQQLRATFENPDRRLLPGQFVRVRVISGRTDDVFLLPQVAVMTSDLGRYVYVIENDNVVAARQITIGEWIGKDWIILDGLHPGDQVVINNLIRLSPGMVVSPERLDASAVLSSGHY